MTSSTSISLIGLKNFPLVEPGDDLPGIIVESVSRTVYQGKDLSIQHGDVLVLAQKIVSKVENRYVYLNQIKPSKKALEWANKTNKDPRLVELILNESTDVIRARSGVMIVAHKNGYVHANAGIDQSNIDTEDDNPCVLLLPENADVSANKIRQALHEKLDLNIPVIINDSAGRAWRTGVIGMAIGTSGIRVVENLIGQKDLFGRSMKVTQVAIADELAVAASLVMGQTNEGCPVVLIRGASVVPSSEGSQNLIRPIEQDLFR